MDLPDLNVWLALACPDHSHHRQALTWTSGMWLFGSRAMGRHGPGSDIDLCLEGPALSHNDRLALMAAVDELLLPWRVDLVLREELPAELEAHVQRVGTRIWEATTPAPGGGAEP